MEEIKRKLFDIPVLTFDGKNFTIRATRLINEKKQPLILWEGFYQNGIFFDLESGQKSIGEFLQRNNYDVWIINSRGSGGSTGKNYSTSMDDFAATDIPAVINFILDKTGEKPILAGHSQGGNTALMSLMGTIKNEQGEVQLSEDESEKRQSCLKGLVTLGSYLDFTFDKPSSLQEFVTNGVVLNIFGKKIKIISTTRIVNILKILKRLPVPCPLSLRKSMLQHKFIKGLLFPLTITLNFISLMNTWEFLYHIPNVSKQARLNIFYRTMEATYWGILYQYQQAVLNRKMMSCDKRVNYSANYQKIKLPVSVVTMEYDTLADAVETKGVMFPKLGSTKKYFTTWMGQGHEDFVMNPDFFHQLLEAIKLIDN